MKSTFKKFLTLYGQLFTEARYGWKQFLIVLLISLIFIWMPQSPPSDWELNTQGFWSDVPRTYLHNPNFVYPPWALILLLPYYWMHAAGARMLSVATIGWLSYRRKWPFHRFFAIVLSPYFLVTMTKTNMDILVILFPVLLWEVSRGRKWEIIARGIALSILFIKPQCTFLLLLYFLWISRMEWKKVLSELGIVAIFVIPISIVGTPPLLMQWLHNIIQPSAQNQNYWSINNISLTARFNVGIALGLMALMAFILFLGVKWKVLAWNVDLTLSTLLLGSMYLLPYTSQQSLSAGLAFTPSWAGFIVQWLGIALGFATFGFHNNFQLWTLVVSFLSLMFYGFFARRKEMKMQSEKPSDQVTLAEK